MSNKSDPRREPVKEFIKRLESLDRSRSTREKFRDLMEMGYCAWAKLMASSEQRAETLEARYMQIVNRYKDKDAVRAYPDLLGIAWDAIRWGGGDFFGMVAGELNVLDGDLGQIFTPFEVSRMMASINLGGIDEVIERQGYATILEPACGSGGMIIAAADVLQEMKFDPAIHMLVQAVDVSPIAYWMCYLQLTFRGVPALVFHGNSLSLETWDSAWTLPTKVFYEFHGHLFDRPEYDLRSEQLSLFEDLQAMVGVTR